MHIREVRQGHRPGERYVRIHRPFHDTFREASGDTLVAREHVFVPRGKIGKVWGQARRFLIGRPLASSQLAHERLPKTKALAVFASDALSSSSYATEEILRILILGGALGLAFTLPVAGAIGLLLAVVVISYRQTIKAYPHGGGSYIVSKDNLGNIPALVAASALLTSYVLTVAVSISAGVFALTSAAPVLHEYRVWIACGLIGVMTLINLRGVSESGTIFAAPTYLFIVSALGMIGYGLFQIATGELTPDTTRYDAELRSWESKHLFEGVGLLLVLRAFAQGCAALTGTEAISDGVPAFKPPEWKNAMATLTWMGIILAVLFLGISYLATSLAILPDVEEAESVVSMIARAVFGEGPLYYLLQGATMLILVLAANTAYADFPRLASILARDRYVPRQFMNQGDRLAFSNGIVGLSAFAAILLVAFGGDTHALIPLYMIGVFVSFTLSQAGMVVHWKRTGGAGWRSSAIVNGIGAIVTGGVLLVVAATKTFEGAWIILLLIPATVALFRITQRHYDRVATQLRLDGWRPRVRHNTVIVPISGVQRAVAEALQYASTLSTDVRAVYVDVDPAATEDLKRSWCRLSTGIPLVALESPFRSLMEPLLEYVERVSSQQPDGYVTVVLPEFVPARWWHHLFHNQRALLIKGALLFKPNTVVTSVPFHLRH